MRTDGRWRGRVAASAETALEAVASIRADFILPILARVLLGQPSLAYERRTRNRRSFRHGFVLALIALLRVSRDPTAPLAVVSH